MRVYALPCFFEAAVFEGVFTPLTLARRGKYFSPGEFSRKSRNPEKKLRNHYRRNVSGFSKSRKLTPVMVSLVFFGISGFSGFSGKSPGGKILLENFPENPENPEIPKKNSETITGVTFRDFQNPENLRL